LSIELGGLHRPPADRSLLARGESAVTESRTIAGRRRE